jgi:hypothetical protein
VIASLARLAVWLLLAASLIVTGWDEPLRYKFMSIEAIEAEERRLLEVKPPVRQWQPSGTALDKPAY